MAYALLKPQYLPETKYSSENECTENLTIKISSEHSYK